MTRKERYAKDPVYREKIKEANRLQHLLKSKEKKDRIREKANAREKLVRAADPVYRERRDAAQKAHRAAVKAWINAYKLERGCLDCGYKGHPAALDFDHTDGKTKDISFLASIKRVLKEIEQHKCEVVCANCHRIRTVNRRKP